jgi:hypothetical protein
VIKIIIKNDAKIWSKWSGYKLSKKWHKNDQKSTVINWPENAQKLICHGGVKNVKKSINFDLGDPGP